MKQAPEPLNCETFEDRIHQILDDRLMLTGDSALMEHAARCASCESVLYDYDAVEDSITIFKDDINAILDRVEQQPRRRSIAQRPLVMLATLAAGLLVCLFAYQQLPEKQNTSFRPIASKVKRSESRKTKVAIKTISPRTSSVNRSSLAVANAKQTRYYRPTPDTSPFSRNFSVSKSLPRIPSSTNWSDMTDKLAPLEPVLNYSSELFGVRATQCSIAVTFELLRQSLNKHSLVNEPDLGMNREIILQATA